MSLLRSGTEVVTVFPEETVTDSDGNRFTRAGTVGIIVKASVQPVGTGLQDRENADGGFHTTSRYRLRLAGGYGIGGGVLGSQAQVEWRGKRYAIEGDAQVRTGSVRTAHAIFTMVRR